MGWQTKRYGSEETRALYFFAPPPEETKTLKTKAIKTGDGWLAWLVLAGGGLPAAWDAGRENERNK